MTAPKSGGLPRRRMSPLEREIERDRKFQGPPKAPKPPSKNMFKQRDKSGKVIRALAGASVPGTHKRTRS